MQCVAPKGKIRLIAIAHQLEGEETSWHRLGDFEIDDARARKQDLLEDPHFCCGHAIEAFDDQGRGVLI
jgi:hypothetical protein